MTDDPLLEELAQRAAHGHQAHTAPWFDPEEAETVLAPDGGTRGYWVGAPTVVADTERGRVLLGYRRRRPRDGSPDERGYRAAIAESTDGGRTFRDIWALTKHEVGTSSLERFCLRRLNGQWFLYTSWEDPPGSGQWRVDLLRADAPDAFRLPSSQAVLSPRALGVDAVKDPYLFTQGQQQLLYVSTFLSQTGPAPTTLALSTDGAHFEWQGQTMPVGEGWDAYQARITCVMPFGGGFVCYYDGARSAVEDTEERCGWAVSTDLRHWRRVSGQGPALVSPHASGSLRYVDVVDLGGTAYAYFEYARPDGAHELRRAVLGPR